MSSLRAILFDLDDTLILDEELTEAAFREAAAAAGVAAERAGEFAQAARAQAVAMLAAHPEGAACEALGMAASELLWAEFEHPVLAAWAPVFRLQTFRCAVEVAGGAGDPAQASAIFARARLAGERLMPGARETLEALRPTFRLGLLTNGDSRVQRGKLERSGLAPFFDAVVVSGEEGIGKPEPAVFQRLLSRLGVSAAEAAMVGNSLRRDIAGANAAGLAAAVWLCIEGAEEFAQATPTHVITSLADLPGALNLPTPARAP